jgi:hypothetical protein
MPDVYLDYALLKDNSRQSLLRLVSCQIGLIGICEFSLLFLLR